MQSINKRDTLAAALLMAALSGLAGCSDADDGPAEQAGEQVDEAVEQAEDTAEEMADEAGETVEETGDAVEEATD